MKSRIKHAFAAILGGLLLAATTANAAITFTGGQGDLTFYYESAADRWDVVFRNKGAGTGATGLDNGYTGFTGIVGLGDDYTFNSLQVNVSSAALQTVNGKEYLITPANGSSIYQNTAQPDLGIRMRLRENEVALGSGSNTEANQFDNPRLTLDWAASSKPVGADFILFGWDAFENPADIRYETAAGDFSHDWGNWGHDHWHFGFSEAGDYSLVFGVDGIGGPYGATDGPSQVTVNFNVVPEPSATLLGMLALGALGLRRRRG